MLPDLPTAPAAVRARFEEILARILDGEFGGCPTDTGLDMETMQALDVVGFAIGSGRDTTPAVAIARQAIDDMLSGEHERRNTQERIEFARQWDLEQEAKRRLDQLRAKGPTTE